MHVQQQHPWCWSSSLPPNPYLSGHFSVSSQFPKFKSYPRRTFTVKSSIPNARTKPILPQTAIQRIADKLRSLGFSDDHDRPTQPPSAAGEIFVPLPTHLPKLRVGHTIDTSWSSPENPVPAVGTGAAFVRFRELKREVRNEIRNSPPSPEERGRVPTLAELTIPAAELRRVRTLGLELRKKLKVGKAGITEGIVNGIHERWRRCEVVKIECEDICRMNMKRTHDLLEKKTGGLVVWRSGSKIVLYRGTNYVYPYFFSDGRSMSVGSDSEVEDVEEGEQIKSSSLIIQDREKPVARPALIRGVGVQNRVRFQLPGEAQLAEEADRLLDGLGPRFADWWGYDPQPVDADLLPPIVHGYRRPFRLLPYGVLPKLTNDEMTTLRRLARPLPCHFALGRNRNLQGLASCIVKLWERCEVVKIAVKRGVQNTNSEIMVEEIKSLTGGTLLARDREFIVLYRGKDFLPHTVSAALEERRKSVMQKKLRTADNLSVETAQNEVENSEDSPNETSGLVDDETSHLREQKKTSFIEASVKRTSAKLSMAIEKKENAERLLSDLSNAEMRQQPEMDKEGITAEERHMLRKIGLKMKPFLLLGRRGVFDGSVENMHLHWKYRELVKIITNEKSFDVVHDIALTLEAESGGILVSVERVSKGHAIIVYRGKNYSRPASLRPKTLLSKKAALRRSIEAQRRQSLKLHVLKLNKNIEDLKSQLDKDKEAEERKTIDEISEQVQEEVDESHEVESSSLNAEVGIFFPSVPTVSPKEISTLEEMSSSVADVVQSGVSDNNEVVVSSAKSHKTELVPVLIDSGRREIPSSSTGAIYLSNRDRLLLRRQALKMKYRPVLAVGRNNIMTGVAKTIKAHFKNYPLAIVNVKGRAEGTSVQEVVFMLQQLTGAVLVSLEPNKVILYRGWGAEESSDGKKIKKKGTTVSRRELETRSVGTPAVSPELLDAIRTECGLQNQQKLDKFM